MRKIIVCSAFILGVLAIGSQLVAQACDGSCCKPKTEKPAPAPDKGE